MKLYSTHHILQQKLAKSATLAEIRDLCRELKIRVEVQLLPSDFSSLKWDLLNNQLSGRFIAHITTTIIQDGTSDENISSLTPTAVHFVETTPVTAEKLEAAIFEAIRKSFTH